MLDRFTEEKENKMQVATLQDLIKELHVAFEGDVVDVDYVQQLMQAYKTNPAEWKQYAKFDRYRYLNYSQLLFNELAFESSLIYK